MGASCGATACKTQTYSQSTSELCTQKPKTDPPQEQPGWGVQLEKQEDRGETEIERLRENLANFAEKLSKTLVNRVLESFRWTGFMSRPDSNFLESLKCFSRNRPSFPATALYGEAVLRGVRAVGGRLDLCYLCCLLLGHRRHGPRILNRDPEKQVRERGVAVPRERGRGGDFRFNLQFSGVLTLLTRNPTPPPNPES